MRTAFIVFVVATVTSAGGCSAGVDPPLTGLVAFKSMDPPRGGVLSVASNGKYLFAASMHGIQIYAVMNGKDAMLASDYQPKGVGVLNLIEYVSIRGTILYYLDTDGTHVADITIPTSPREINLVPYFDKYAMRDAAAKTNDGGARFVASQQFVFDLIDPTRPTQVGSVGVDRALTMDGTTLYVGSDDGVAVWDMTTPATPKVLGRVNGSPWQLFVAARGIVYCGVGEQYTSDRSILDARNPAQPVYNGIAPKQGTGWQSVSGFVRQGHYVYTAPSNDPTLTNAVSAFDVSDVMHPRLVRSRVLFETGTEPLVHLAADDRFLYAATLDGVVIIGPQ